MIHDLSPIWPSECSGNVVLLVFGPSPGHTRCSLGATVSPMLDPKPFSAKSDRNLLPPPRASQQQRLMIVALTLLLIALGFVLYRDRDFWFPDTQEADNQPLQTAPVSATAPPTHSPQASATPKKTHARTAPPVSTSPAADTPTPPATITRTVLPPLEVEVVAGSVHRTVHPGTNTVHVDLQPALPAHEAAESSDEATNQTAASVTSNAAERTQMSADTADIVAHSVRPGYPMLARQMKVQGSVILQALIGRDGLIQDLRVVSGPPILATAAREAVKQWHFRPHYDGANAVETQAKITVNFTISTN